MKINKNNQDSDNQKINTYSYTPWSSLFDDFSVFPLRISDLNYEREIPTDIWEDEDNVYVRVATPGIKNEDLNVTINKDSLRVYGKSTSEKEESKNTRYYMQHISSQIDESYRLPSSVDVGKADAKYENGILNITMPKKEDSKSKQVKIK